MAESPAEKRGPADLMLRMWELVNTGQLDKLDEVVAHDVELEWPQSQERVRGIENLRHILGEYPGGGIAPKVESTRLVKGEEGHYLLTPMFTMVRVQSAGDTAFLSVKTRYPDGSDWYIASTTTARGGKLVKLLQYFAPIYPAPEWRAQWVEPMAEGE